MSQADRVLEALTDRPNLMFDLLTILYSKDETVASPWTAEDTREDPKGNCVAQVMSPQGHEHYYSWWAWDDTVGTGDTAEEAMAEADDYLSTHGWVLC